MKRLVGGTGTFWWFDAELDPDNDQFWFRIAEESIGPDVGEDAPRPQYPPGRRPPSSSGSRVDRDHGRGQARAFGAGDLAVVLDVDEVPVAVVSHRRPAITASSWPRSRPDL